MHLPVRRVLALPPLRAARSLAVPVRAGRVAGVVAGVVAGIVAGAALPGGSAAAATSTDPLHRIAAELGTTASGLTVEGQPGAVTRLGASAGQAFARAHGLSAHASATAAARAFVAQHRELLGSTALGAASAERSDVGSVVRLQQTVRGLPVLGGAVTVAVTRDARVQSLTGATTRKAPAVLPSVTTSAATAAATAVTATARADQLAAGDLRASRPQRVFYDPALLRVPGGGAARVVWSVEVSSPSRLDVDRRVLVDEIGGRIALQWDQVERVAAPPSAVLVCNASDRVVDYTCPSTAAPAVASTANPPTGAADTDVQQAYAQVGGVLAFYRDVLGRNGIDGSGGAVAATVHVCEAVDDCPMDNAFWDGRQMVFGDGFAGADDVVAHEMTHGVTDATSGLFYLYQSGSIDESLSDVMGELYDQWDGTGRDTDGTGGTIDYRWMMGEDLPATVGVLRDMRTPGTAPTGVPTPDFTPQPDAMTSPLYAQVVDPKTGAPLDSGQVHINSGVGNKAAELIVDGGTLNGVRVAGLGGAAPVTRAAAVAKAAHLYYLVDQLLPSGADYADLAATLSQACAAIVGKPLADGHGGKVVVSRTDCASVREAVAATRMTSDPKKASAPDAPTCSAGTPQSFGFRDDFENTAAKLWKTGAGWYDPQIRDRVDPNLSYASSGHNELYGSDGDTARDAAATMLKTYAVPVGKASYLRFDQAYLLDYEPAGDGEPALYFDGGRVEYSANGGPWTSAAKLFDFGGYNASVTGYNQDTQSYAFRGFGGDSHGYRSSRLSLTSLAGKTVRFRFRLTTDSFGSSYGWFIDDVGFYACGAKPSAVKATAVRHATSATLSWTPPADHGTTPLTKYVVTVVDLTARRTTATVPVKPSTHRLTVVTLRGHRYRFTVAAYDKAGRGAGASVSA